MDDIIDSLCDRHGIFLRANAIAIGLDDRFLGRARRSRLIHRLRHGAYSKQSHWDSLNETERHVLVARAAMKQARADVALSHTTAAVLHGAPFWRVPLDEVHLTRTDGAAGRRMAGVVQHRGTLGPRDLIQIDETPVTSPTRTALELTTIVGLHHSLPVLDDFLRRKLTTRAELEAGVQAMRQWAHTLGTGIAVGLADGRRESLAESLVAKMLWGSDIVMPEPQFEFRDAHGHLLGRGDFAWAEKGVWLEFDGKEKYLKHRREGETVLDAILRERRREEAIVRATGWRCIRITWADLMNPERTIALIRSVLAGGAVYA